MSVELGGSIVARSDDAVLLFEPGRYPVAYFPLGDIAAEVLRPTDHRTTHLDLGETKWFDVVGGDGGQTFCPYKGLASYYDIGDARHAAWSYRAPFEAMARIGDLVSFEPDKVEVTIDGRKLEPVPGQTVIAHGPDRNLSVDEVGGIELMEKASPARMRG